MNPAVFLNSTDLGGSGVCLAVFILKVYPYTLPLQVSYILLLHTEPQFPLSAFLKRAQNQLQTFSLCHCVCALSEKPALIPALTPFMLEAFCSILSGLPLESSFPWEEMPQLH